MTINWCGERPIVITVHYLRNTHVKALHWPEVRSFLVHGDTDNLITKHLMHSCFSLRLFGNWTDLSFNSISTLFLDGMYIGLKFFFFLVQGDTDNLITKHLMHSCFSPRLFGNWTDLSFNSISTLFLNGLYIGQICNFVSFINIDSVFIEQ